MSDFWSNLVDSGLNLLFPPYGNATQQENLEKGFEYQDEMARWAIDYINQTRQEQTGLNQPIIDMSNEQLANLQQGIKSGRFQGNENLFNNYYTYNPQEYKPLSPYSNREAQPEFTGAPSAIQYDQNGQPTIDDTAGQAPTLAGQRDYSYSGQQPGPYQFNQYQYQGNQAPAPFSYNQQQPQFNPYQIQQQQPQQYIAPEAQAANYWKPEQFSVGDDPVYQRALSEANRATESSAAAQGMQLSGATLKGLQENAVGLANEYGQEAFNRYVTQQGMQQQAQNYQNEDIQNRYLQNVGIRSAEGQQALGQYNLNRQFGQTSNLENAAMGNQMWNTGFQNALAAQGQNYGQYAQGRGMDLSEYQTNLGGEQWGYGTNLGQYNLNRDYNFGVQQALSSDDLNRYNAQANQYNIGRNYDLSRFGAEASQFNQNVQNQLAVQGQGWQQVYDPYLTNLEQYNQNRGFNYGRYMDYGDQLANAYNTNTSNQQLYNAMEYNRISDAYNRSTDRGQTDYGMIGDLVNLGVGARQQNIDMATAVSGDIADLGIGISNAYASMLQGQNQNTGIFSTLGL